MATTNPQMDNVMGQLITMGTPIGLIMTLYMGVKWIIAEGPEERENSRRAIIYIIIGLIMLRAARPLVEYLLC
jgi:hypothetical protein